MGGKVLMHQAKALTEKGIEKGIKIGIEMEQKNTEAERKRTDVEKKERMKRHRRIKC